MVSQPQPQDEPSRIVIRMPNHLGDLIIATGFVQSVLARFPGTPVDLIVREGFQALPLPGRGEILPFPQVRWGATRLGWKLRGRNISHFFVLPPSFSSAWMARLSAAPYRLGYQGQGRGWLLRPGLGEADGGRKRHLLDEYLALLVPWAPVANARPHLPVSADWVAAHLPKELAALPSYIVLAPGAEYGPAKQWPVAHYRELARELSAAGWRVVITGVPRDYALGAELIRGIEKSALNLCGATALPGLLAVLANSALVVSNDSGAMHLAAALDRPQVAIFGSTNPVWTGPVNPLARVVYAQLFCSPCYQRTCPLGHLACLKDLTAKMVMEQIEDLIKSEGLEAPQPV